MKCEVCEQLPLTNSKIILYRVNSLGIKGIWRCQYHLNIKIDKEIIKLSDLLSEGAYKL